MRRCGEVVVGDGMTVGHPAPVGKSLIFFCRTCQNGISGVPYCQNGIRILGIDGMSMENAMVRQAKLGRTNRMKGVCTAKKTTCR